MTAYGSLVWSLLAFALSPRSATCSVPSQWTRSLLSVVQDVDAFPLEESDWVRLQATYAAQLASAVAHEESFDAILYGDSIFEALRGTLRGRPDANFSDIPAVWDKHFSNWKALPLGIAGDRTPNMLWRIRDGGEAPLGLICRSAVLLIGTNDFYNHYNHLYGAVPMSETALIVSEISAGVIASVIELHSRLPRTHLVLVAILPRGDVDTSNPHHFNYTLPSMFSPAISQINQRLEEFATQQRYVKFVDCSATLVMINAKGEPELDPLLVADGLHPTAKGMDSLLDCIKSHLLPPSHHRKTDSNDHSSGPELAMDPHDGS